MKDVVREAIDSARTAPCNRLSGSIRNYPERRLSFETVRNAVLAVLNELPDDMTLEELRDELSHASNQYFAMNPYIHKIMLYGKLYSQLSAIETLYVCNKNLTKLNERGVRLLRYLRSRRARQFRGNR